MADIVFNVAKGAAVEWMNRVNANDPAASELVIMALLASGLEADSVLRDKTTFADVVSGATDEATNSGYAKKVLGDGSVTVTIDQANDRVDIDIADQTFTGIAASPGAWGALVFGYDPVGAQTMSEIIPISKHDFSVTPDGGDIVAQVANFFRAA